MPGTEEEILETARQLAAYELAPDLIPEVWWADGTGISPDEWRHIVGLMRYQRSLTDHYYSRGQRRAMRLLGRYLSPEQKRSARRNLRFYVQAKSGRVYELNPRTGNVSEVVKRGARFYRIQSFCLHDYSSKPEDWKERMPPADLSLAHLLLLSCDEQRFLDEANATLRIPDGWPEKWDKSSEAARRIEQVIAEHYERERDNMRRLAAEPGLPNDLRERIFIALDWVPEGAAA